jgi:hypothetical protein
MGLLSAADFKALVEQNNGDEEAARALVKQQGLAVEGEETSDLSARPDITALRDILTGQRKSVGDLYDTITQNIQKRYRAPDINDMLIAIGTGMMSAPQEGDNSGFAGAVQRGIRGIGPYAQSRRAYETDMNKMMSQVEIQKAKDLAGLEEKYATGAASLLKPKTPSTSSPITVGSDLVTRSRAYGTTIKEPPQPAIYELQAYLADPTALPQDKAIARRNFDSRFGYGAAEIFGGAQ